VVLPTLVPVGVLAAAWPEGHRRLSACVACGMAVSAVMGADVAGRQVTASSRGHVLDYGLGIEASWLLIAGYLIATLGAPLLSPDRLVRWFGTAATVGAAGCAAAWRLAFASTWCGYAAVLSVMLLVWVRRERADAGDEVSEPVSARAAG